MLENQTLIMYRQNTEGNHWLTTVDFPPLQLPLVAANQRRVAAFVLSEISHKITQEINVPTVINLVDKLGKKENIYVQLDLETAAIKEDYLDGIIDELYLTPRPLGYWAGSYDQWFFSIAKKLGMIDAPIPAPKSSYELALQKAILVVRQKIPYLRELFLQGFNVWKLYLKINLLNNHGEKVFIWCQPISWGHRLKVILMSEPFDCDDYWLGQELEIPEAYIVDYCITDDLQHFADNTLTHKVAEDYGVMHYHF